VNALLGLLDAARSKNQRLNITGALISQAGVFAQVLEGPQQSVEHVLGLVQHDDRNSNVTVALHGPEAERVFPRWSMAFGDGEESGGLPVAQVAIDAVLAKQEGAGENLLALQRTLVVHEDNLLL
jgi:hypothetical protein